MNNTLGAYIGRSAAPDLGDSRTTAGLAWTGAVLDWADLPPAVQDANAGGTVVAEGVTAVPGARRIDGVAHQVRLAWRAWNDLVVVVTVTRPLYRRDDGKLAPDGPWAGRRTDEYPATTAARHTRSTIAPGVPALPGDPRGAGVCPRDQEGAAEAFPYLPSPVRGALVKAVPNPTVWAGELTRHTLDGRVTVEERLVMCRLDDTGAVVLTATRSAVPAQLPSADWTINRHTFTFIPVRPKLGRGAPTPRIER